MTEQQYRHELKYVISQAQIPLLKSRIERFMQIDPHVLNKGFYTIRSLYFDDYHNRCFYENENGTDPREKFRVRIYDGSAERISLECKRKEREKTLKTSCVLQREQFDNLMTSFPKADNDTLLNKLLLKVHTKLMRPVVIVEYERTPYIFQNGNVRITFDMNISSSSPTADFFGKRIPKRPIMPLGQHLLEVKYDEFLPDFIYSALNLSDLQRTNYSKYYLCRKYNIKEK